jgi:catechol 2,3-dioxygenase-like lactoylglutathione lyase family enzyme
MIDHVTLSVTDFERALRAYQLALAPLGYELVMSLSQTELPSLPAPRMAGLGVGGKPDLWLRQATGPVTPIHVALRAPSRAAVDAFYAAAFTAGLRDHGPPGLRRHYHPDYYAAFVLDADDHNLEAVHHGDGAATT